MSTLPEAPDQRPAPAPPPPPPIPPSPGTPPGVQEEYERQMPDWYRERKNGGDQ